jgi:hypothetical protein
VAGHPHVSATTSICPLGLNSERRTDNFWSRECELNAEDKIPTMVYVTRKIESSNDGMASTSHSGTSPTI